MSNPSKRPRREARKAGRRKGGRDFEEAVRDIFRNFFPRAEVHSGVWVVGPDGRRELDVDISEKVGAKLFRGVIECKDFNPATTGPVGIEYIDALDSKRRDLRLDVAMLCSNAGFTGTAVRKARRLGIGLIAAVRKGDERIRFRVTEEIYVRHIRLKSISLRFWPAPGETLPPYGVISPEEVTFKSRQIVRWFNVRFLHLLGVNPIVKGKVVDSCRLKDSITIEWPSGKASVSQIACEVEFDGAWFAQTVELAATEGTYDWLRKRMRLTPSPETRQLQLVDLNINAGSWIERPENMEWDAEFLPHEVEVKMLMVENAPNTDEPADLDPYVHQDDLDLKIRTLPPDAVDSTPEFKISPPSAASVSGVPAYPISFDRVAE